MQLDQVISLVLQIALPRIDSVSRHEEGFRQYPPDGEGYG